MIIRWNPSHTGAKTIGYESNSTFRVTGPTVTVFVTNQQSVFDILLYDKYDNLSKVLSNIANIQWEYNRIGGCGQALIEIDQPYDSMESAFVPNCSVKILYKGQLRYWGKMLKYRKNIKTKQDNINLTMFGYQTELSNVVVSKTYVGTEVSLIIKDILDNYVTPNTKITYNAANIVATGYSVSNLVLNHTAQDAIALLADFAGNTEWGVDCNRSFFFKQTDPNIKGVYIIGREIDQYQEERDDSQVLNVVNVYGASNAFIATITSQMSINKFGRKEYNVFESSISTNSDANRLGSVAIQAGGNSQRAIKFRFITPDVFIETMQPLGARAVNLNKINQLNKYGPSTTAKVNKYGVGLKYGAINRDQFQNIRYVASGGGLEITATMNSDLPNMGDNQKQLLAEIQNQQRR